MLYKRLLFIALSLLSITGYAAQAASCPSYTVCFTPNQTCKKLILNTIRSAKTSILAQAYDFNSLEIAQALVAAKKRGVQVQLQLDRSWYKSAKGGTLPPTLLLLAKNSIPIWVDIDVGKAHNKTMVIDNRKVITGSYNFTATAYMHNAENVLLIEGDDAAEKYRANWETRLKSCKLMPKYQLSSRDELEKFKQEMLTLEKTWQAKYARK
jgi:phosphatidylserine/phosphatidylglycerophosphate/cardiolipin synthase-like enzyme